MQFKVFWGGKTVEYEGEDALQGAQEREANLTAESTLKRIEISQPQRL